MYSTVPPPKAGVVRLMHAARYRPSRRKTAVILWRSLLECLMTLVLLFGANTFVRWVVGPSPISSAIPTVRVRLLIIGAAVGVLLFGLILSPAGRASGGHVNPAITLTMWLSGAFPGAAVIPYIVAQLAGSLLGVVTARAVWGSVIDGPPVNSACLQPAPGWTNWALFPAEAASMAAIVLPVAWFLAAPRLAPLVPGLVGILVGLAIAVLGPITGGSLNPARQFGPAIFSGDHDFLWVYLLAPMVGAALATMLFKLLTRRRVLTHKLCGTHKDGSPR